MDALVCLKTRRSVRRYGGEAVPRQVVEDIIDCGRLAPTARNEQPWEFVAVSDAELRRRIADIAEYGKFIADAPVCIVVLCKDTRYYVEDGSAATTNIVNAAHAHGLGSCWVAGDKKPYAPEIASLVGSPEGYKLVALIALGHAEEVSHAPKRPLHEVVHWDRFQ